MDPSTWVRVMAPLLFALAWLGMAFRWPLLPVGRTLSTMVCAVMAVALGVISPEDAFASVSLATLALLFGSMVMAALLEREGFFTHVQRLWCMGLPAGSGGGGADAAAATSSTNFSTLLTRLCSFFSTAFLSAAIQLTTLLIELVAREPNVMFFIDA